MTPCFLIFVMGIVSDAPFNDGECVKNTDCAKHDYKYYQRIALVCLCEIQS